MDIKSKSSGTKFVFLIITFFVFAYGVATTLQNINYAPELETSYFKTNEFAHEIEEFINLFSEVELDYVDFETAKEQIQVTNEDIQRVKDQNLTRLQEEIALLDIELYEENQEINEEAIATKRNEQVEVLKEKYNLSQTKLIALAKEQKVAELQKQYDYLTEQRERFQYMKQYIDFYIKDSTGTVYSNLDNTDYEHVKTQSVFAQKFPYHTRMNDSLTGVNRVFITRDVTGFIAIPKDNHSLIMENMYDYQDRLIQFFIQLAISVTALVIGAIFLYRSRATIATILESLRLPYYKIPIDIRIVGLLITLFFLLISFGTLSLRYISIGDFVVFVIILALFFMQCKFTFETIKRKQFKDEWKKGFIYKQKNAIKNSFLYKSPFVRILLLAIISGGLGFATLVVIIQPEAIFVYLFLMFVFGGGTLLIGLKKIALFNSILETTKEMAEGNVVKEIEVKGNSPLMQLAKYVNQLARGVQVSQQVQAKSERLKTELISNVSHDLRTPLTSIINYTNFLKNDELSDEERRKYIDIIDNKSQRLKVLIDDLFEVSKMATGNIELQKEHIDIMQLLKQSLGEYDEKLTEANLTIKLNTVKPQLFVYVDGAKMWRVFDNIIGNILKYSLQHTRVYINVEETDQDVKIVFKNISKYDLKENVDELFERFKRGDESRQTDGSGLGLAIAKTIVDHHNGNLEIELDGDLFKTIVTLMKS
ncbi:GHKL domain-containing protein [Bacillus sp. HMF5848]|uniref:sensor histidine kinase n=1 Tax=Bacillus sp. HMF5848 TaxID=2495421 RepID=UPI000F77772C|nr:HAMP domain-containing sensor histidine kinase [Bacillus sp. HMF5848]RSK28166.1 GHKL domain-containing protein [Bacillus sp. HMF5848]